MRVRLTNIRLVVTGGRDFEEEAMVWDALDYIHDTRVIACLIAGRARGADTLAEHWALSRGVPVIAKPADWKQHGRRAGPLRNIEMLNENPDACIAFPGGSGTTHMIRICEQAGKPVWEPYPKYVYRKR
jgi:hypothetical protein